MNVAGYMRVSTREQGDSGLSLLAQRRRIAEHVAGREDWRLGTMVTEVKSGADMRRRPELRRLLSQLDNGEYGALVVMRLDRMTRSLMDFALTMDRAHRHGWSLVLIDSGIDMTTPWGRAMAGMAAVWAQLQRELISENTRLGLELARERGTFRPGEHCRYSDEHVIARMRELRGGGVSYGRIARLLTLEGHAAPTGGRWHPRTISRILQRHDREQTA